MNAPTLGCISASKFPRIDFTITHCVNAIEEMIASIRQNPALGWPPNSRRNESSERDRVIKDDTKIIRHGAITRRIATKAHAQPHVPERALRNAIISCDV
jgi:hypothetical protein